jgi:hypothetical protein
MKKITFLLILNLFFNLNFAQKSIVVSGGKASGITGTASFSVGQISYKNPIGNVVSVGVQQPYEIQTLGNSNFTNIVLEIITYPNPTTDELHLKIIDVDLQEIIYQLYDINGKKMSVPIKISQLETIISFQKYDKGIYFLEVLRENKKVKTFKIIKK